MTFQYIYRIGDILLSIYFKY